MVLIFVIGHAINIFMNVLGAMVHPMRLTFVETIGPAITLSGLIPTARLLNTPARIPPESPRANRRKNSGYEGGGKEYKPFRNLE